MSFANKLIDAYNTKWSFINTFTVVFVLPTKFSEYSDLFRDIDLHIINVDTPQFTNQPVEVFFGNKWNIHNGRDELYRFSITFRDKNQMELYAAFVKMYHSTREDFFDNVKMTVSILKDRDWKDEDLLKSFSTYEDVIIESVSQLQFNNTTEDQIAEFTVNFKTTKPNMKR